MPGSYDKFLADAVRAGYDVPAVEAEVRKAIPQLFLAAKGRKMQPEVMKQRLQAFGLPDHLWTDPADLPPEQTPPGLPQDLEERMARTKPFEDPNQRGPQDPATTSIFQQLSKMLTMPGRGGRALGVTAANLPQGIGPAVTRGAEAVAPGFQPQGVAETLLGTGGQMAGDMALGGAIAGPVGGVARAGLTAAGEAFGTAAPPLLGRLAVSGVQGAAVGGAFQALQEMAARGHVSAEDVAQATKLGAGAGVAIQGGTEAAQALWGKIAPAVAVRIQSELAQLRYRIQKGTGLDMSVQTGLVPYDFKKAVSEGRMTLAEAARQSEDVFKQQLGIRAQLPTEEAAAKATETPQEPAVAPEAEVPVKPVKAAPARTSGGRKGKKAAQAPAEVPTTPEVPGFTPPEPGPQTPAAPGPLAPVGQAGPLDAPVTPPPGPNQQPEEPGIGPHAFAPGQEVTTAGGSAGTGTKVTISGWDEAHGKYLVRKGAAETHALTPEQITEAQLPISVRGIEAAEPITDRGQRALANAMHSTVDAEGRWSALWAKNPTDEQIKQQLGFELGSIGGSGGPGEANVSYRGNDNPRVYIGDSVGSGKPTLQGKAIIQAARKVLETIYGKPSTPAVPQLPAPTGSTPLGVKPTPPATPPTEPVTVKPAGRWGPKIPPAPAKNPFASAIEGYEDSGNLTAQDAANEIEAALNDLPDDQGANVRKALDAYREAHAEDRKLKGRGDTDTPFEALLAEAKRYGVVTAPEPEIGQPMTVEVIAKARKQAALDQVQKELEAAKPEKSLKANETAKTIEVKIDGGIKVKATKEALADLMVRLKHLPEKVLLGRQKYPLQKLTYTAARKEKFNALIKVEGKTDWFTDGKVMIRGTPPAKIEKSDRPATNGETLEALAVAANAAAKPAKLLYYAVEGEVTEGVSPTPIDDRLAYGKTPPLAVFETPGGYMTFDQRYVTAVINRHPDAEWHVNEAGHQLVARVKDKPVAVVMAHQRVTGTSVTPEPPLATEAQLGGLYEPRPEGPLMSQMSMPGEGPMGDLLTGQETNLPPKEPPVQTADDRRRAFSTFMLTEVDNVRSREILLDLATKLGNIENITFREKQGYTKGFFNPATGEVMIADRDNIATLSHEITHAIDHAMGTRFNKGRYANGLAAKVGRPDDAALEKVLREELKKVSQHVRPYYPKGGDFSADKHWTSYQASHPELFADWGTAFMAEPALARTLAPTFTDLWLKHLQGFPKVKEALEPFLGPDSPLLKTSIQDRNPVDIGREIVDWVKGPELDDGVKDLSRGYAELAKDKMQRLYNLVGLPFWKGQRDPRAGSIFSAIQGITHRAARLENIGLDMADLEAFAKMPQVSREKVADALYFGNDKPVQKYYSNEELSRYPFHMTPEEAKAYQKVVKSIRFGTNMLVSLYKQRIGFDSLPAKDKAGVEAEIRETIEKLGGYFPLMRFGDHIVYGNSADGEDMWYGFEKSSADAKRTANELSKAGYGDVQIRDRRNLPPEFWQRAGGKLSGFEVEHLVEASGADRNDPNIQKVIAQAAKYRFKDMIHRQWVPGFKKSGDNVMESVESYMSSMSHRLAKFEGMKEANGILDTKIDPAKEALLWQDMKRYVKSYGDATGDELYWLRRSFYAYNLAWKPSFFIQKLAQPVLTTWPELARYGGGLDPEKRFFETYGRVFSVLNASLSSDHYVTDSLSPQQGYLVRRLEKEGVLSGQYTQEMLQERLPTRFKIDRVLGFLGHTAEQVSRLHAALAGAQLAEDNGLSKEEAYAFTLNFINRTEFASGPSNQPAWVQQAGRLKGVARLSYALRHFIMNKLERLSLVLGPEFEPKVAGRAVAAFLGLGGIHALPFEAIIAWGLWKYAGQDIEAGLRNKMKNHQKISDLVMGGIPSMLGWDTRRQLGLGDVVEAPRAGAGLGEVAAEGLGGAFGGAVARTGRAKDLWSRGEKWRAIENVTPMAISNLMKADRISKEGLRTTSGKLIVPADKIERRDVLSQALGFMPTTFAKEYDKRDAERRVTEAIASDKSRYTELIAKAIQRRDMPEMQRLSSEIETKNVQMIKDGTPERRVFVSNSAVRHRLLEMQTASVGPRIKSAPRQARRRILDINAAFGQ